MVSHLPTGSDVLLPVDPSLTTEITTMPSLSDDPGPIASAGSAAKQAAIVISEGLPPVSTKILEKIQKWEFVELASLLSHDTPARGEALTITQDGQTMIVQPQEQSATRKKITDISSWLQAFSIYAAGLAASDTTTNDHFKGLMAHMYLMVQLAKDLGGNVWLQYDREFRVWAAAKGVKVWGDLNLSIYGRCLAAQQRPSSAPNRTYQKKPYDRKSKGKFRPSCCYKWNFEGTCRKPAGVCKYLHICLYCGEDHRAVECSSPSLATQPSRGY